jgi:hypothetical protein
VFTGEGKKKTGSFEKKVGPVFFIMSGLAEPIQETGSFEK